jgi:FkbM family methyltransferase
MQTTQPKILVESRGHDALVRSMTRRLPSVAARLVIRLHRSLVGQRLTPVTIGNGITMAVSPQDNLGHHLFYYGAYEPEQGRLWEQLLANGKDLVVLDIGANTGYYSLVAAAHTTVSRVVSFEPNPMVLPVLEYNVAANPVVARKLTVVAAAAGDSDGTVPFYRNFAEHNFGLGSLRARTKDDVMVQVPLVRLDRQLPAMGVDRVDLAKVDVEGAELAVLRGLLSWSRPTLVIEVHPGLLPEFGASVSDLLGTLEEAHYRVRRLCADGQLTSPIGLNEIAWVLAEPK